MNEIKKIKKRGNEVQWLWCISLLLRLFRFKNEVLMRLIICFQGRRDVFLFERYRA